MKRLSQTDQGTTKIINVVDPTAAQDAATKAYVDSLMFNPGDFKFSGAKLAPTGWLKCTGATPLRADYPNLFAAIVPDMGTATITIGSGAVVTTLAHLFVTGDTIYFTTTGALPTGLSANTIYYVIWVSSTTFRLATTKLNALNGTPTVTTSGTQSGTHTVRYCPYGLGNGSTTFHLPDVRGRVLAGVDDMGGGAANRLTGYNVTGSYGQHGSNGGAEKHIIDTSEMAAHVHSIPTTRGGVNWTGGSAQGSDPSLGFGTNSGSTGGGIAHNNTQPTLVVNCFIKT